VSVRLFAVSTEHPHSVARAADAADARRSGAQAIGRAMRVLHSFDDELELGIVELAQRLDLSPSTTHRIVRALVDAHFLDQDLRTERYRLGVGLAELGLRTLQRLGVDAARPVLSDLAHDTGESVNLGIRDGDEVLVLLWVTSPQPLRFEQPAGSRIPVHTSAMGKALLAWSTDPDHEVDRLTELERWTRRTLTSQRALRSELQVTHRRGYALNDEERNLGVRAVAAPILDRQGHAFAAIAVQGPTVRLTDAVVPKLVTKVQAAASRAAILLVPADA
jgi:DNA-binding IclR family transcriptional regulator